MKKKYLALAISGSFLTCPVAYADYHFDPAFLTQESNNKSVADLTSFESGDGVLPGNYSVDIFINADQHFRKNINFKKNSKGEVLPVFSRKQLYSFGIKTEDMPKEAESDDKERQENDEKYFINELFPEATTSFDVNKQRLDISVPQIHMRNDARGYIPPEQWDQGINALMFTYNFTGNQDKNDGQGHSENRFLNLQSGANFGAWRLRDNSSWNYSKSDDGETTSEWQHISTYLERNVEFLKSELKIGDTNTSSAVFDSSSFRGVQLASDDGMLPDSQTGFAPTIRGIAQSNAKVTIKQNGYTLYQTYVPPGAFEINDLMPTSSSGDLDVTITENSGTTQTFSVPYSTVPVLQREGRIKFEVDGGKYQSGGDQNDQPEFVQGTLDWGLAHGITLYGGTQLSDKYKAVALGIGENFGDFGAMSVDITQANSVLADDSEHKGQSVRFLYAKSLMNMGTTVQLLGYRYSTEGFYTFADTTYKMMSGYNDDFDTDDDDDDDTPDYQDYYNLYYTKKGRIQANLNQTLGEWGSVYLTVSQQSYWHTSEKETQYQAGYSGSWNGVSYSLNWTYDDMPQQPEPDQRFSLNVSVPFSLFSHADNSNAYMTFNSNAQRNGPTTNSAGISGSLLAGNTLHYNIQQSNTTQGGGNTGSASLTYDGQYAKSSLGYNYSKNTQQVNYGVNGSMVVHSGGVTFGQPLGDTNILIAAPGADNVNVENNIGVKTDWRGYAIVPYANNYRNNRIALDTRSMGAHVDVEDAVTEVVPTQGALVRATFKAHVGARVLMTVTHNGSPLPFGTVISRDDGDSTIVGEDGQVYLSGLSLEGVMKAVWGNGPNGQCQIKYRLPKDAMDKELSYSSAECH